MTLKAKTLFITGACRGIGLAIAKRAAAGGRALPLAVDIREEGVVPAAVAKAVETFGGIDILVNNASAISLTDTEHTPMKRYDPMNGINARGTYLRTQACLP